VAKEDAFEGVTAEVCGASTRWTDPDTAAEGTFQGEVGLCGKVECEFSFHFFVGRVCLMEECLECIVSIVAGFSDLCKIRISWKDMCFTESL
jgi:hypothetical protein